MKLTSNIFITGHCTKALESTKETQKFQDWSSKSLISYLRFIFLPWNQIGMYSGEFTGIPIKYWNREEKNVSSLTKVFKKVKVIFIYSYMKQLLKVSNKYSNLAC